MLRFLEEIALDHQWVKEDMTVSKEMLEGMIESGWQEKSRDEETKKVTIERWLLFRYEKDNVLNSEKTAEFIGYLAGKEGGDDELELT